MRARIVHAACGAALVSAALATAGGCSAPYAEMPPADGADGGPSGALDATGDASGGDASSDAPSDDAGGPCDARDPNSCPAGLFCLTETCTSGTCAPLPAQVPEVEPVCGCDGVTYWNSSVAAHARMAVKEKGLCPPGPAKPCGGVSGGQCKPGQSCSLEQKVAADCSTTGPQGRCWQLPPTCPSGLGASNGLGFMQCGGPDKCAPLCDLIRAGQPFYPAQCP